MNNPDKVKIRDKIYKLNTDYRVALACNEIAKSDVSDTEKAMAIIYKLYGDEGLDNPQDYEELLRLGQKFLFLGKDIEELDQEDQEPDMDFVQDIDYIEASFFADYHINLADTKMHFWTFYKLLEGLSNSELGDCCILNRIRNLRNTDTTKIKDMKERERVEKAKMRVALTKKEKKYTEEEQNSMNDFLREIGLS